MKGSKRDIITLHIKETVNIFLHYKKGATDEISCFVDADYGSESDRKSTTRFLVKIFGKTVLWTTKR